MINQNEFICSVLNKESDAVTVMELIQSHINSNPDDFPDPKYAYRIATETLETLISEGWIKASLNPDRPLLKMG